MNLNYNLFFLFYCLCDFLTIRRITLLYIIKIKISLAKKQNYINKYCHYLRKF